MKITVNKDKCIGCGLCDPVSAGIFGLGSDGKAVVNEGVDTQTASVIENVKQAAASCPTGAIEITES